MKKDKLKGIIQQTKQMILMLSKETKKYDPAIRYRLMTEIAEAIVGYMKQGNGIPVMTKKEIKKLCEEAYKLEVEKYFMFKTKVLTELDLII